MFFPSPDTATTRPVWRTVQVFERQRMPDPPLPPRPPKVKTKPRKAQTPKVPMPQPGLPTPLSEEQKRWLSKNMKRTRRRSHHPDEDEDDGDDDDDPSPPTLDYPSEGDIRLDELVKLSSTVMKFVQDSKLPPWTRRKKLTGSDGLSAETFADLLVRYSLVPSTEVMTSVLNGRHPDLETVESASFFFPSLAC